MSDGGIRSSGERPEQQKHQQKQQVTNDDPLEVEQKSEQHEGGKEKGKEEEKEEEEEQDDDSEPTRAERAIMQVRQFLEVQQQMMGAGQAENHGQAAKTRRRLHRQQLGLSKSKSASEEEIKRNGGAPSEIDTEVKNNNTSTDDTNTAKNADPSTATTEKPNDATGLKSSLVKKSAAAGARNGSQSTTTKKQKRELITQYTVLLVCVGLIILCLLGMSFLSWKTHGRWWGPLPEHSRLIV